MPDSVMRGRVSYASMDRVVTLDKKDEQLLALLAVDGRATLSRIAKRTRLSPDAVAYRMKKLTEQGVIIRSYANINFERLGYYLFHVFFLLEEDDAAAQQSFIATLKEHANVRSILEYNDRWDFEVSILARSLREFDDIVLGILSKFPRLIIEKDKVETIKRFTSTTYPASHGVLPTMTDEHPPALMARDLKLLELLAHNGRQTAQSLGKELGVSGDTARAMIREYEQKGIITNFSVLVNLSMLGYQWYTYSIQLRTFDRKSEKKFEEFLRQHPNIVRCVKTLGGWDLLLYTVVRSQKEYHTLSKDLKREFAAIIRSYETWMAYEEHLWNPFPHVLHKTLK